MSDKITPHHRARKAILYIRQSSAHQVQHNLESQRLQYATSPRYRYRQAAGGLRWNIRVASARANLRMSGAPQRMHGTHRADQRGRRQETDTGNIPQSRDDRISVGQCLELPLERGDVLLERSNLLMHQRHHVTR